MFGIMKASTGTHKTKKDDILEVASRLFYEQGYNQTGIQQIIQEAGAAKGTFYTFFKSKEELGVAWLKARHFTWNRWLHDFVAPKKTAGEKITAAFDFLGKWMQDCDFRGCAFLNTLGETPHQDSPLRLEISQHKRELHEFFRQLVDAHHANKSEADRAQTAATLFLLFEGTLIHLQNFREDWPLLAAKAQVRSML